MGVLLVTKMAVPLIPNPPRTCRRWRSRGEVLNADSHLGEHRRLMSEKKRGLFEAEGRVPQLRSSGEKRSEPRSGKVTEAGVFLVTSLSLMTKK